MPDEPDASACNAKTVGSVVVTVVNKVVTDTCTGTDCLHNNISVPYAAQSLTGQMAYICHAYAIGDERHPTYQYLWDIYCQATHSVSSQCQPKLMPCPKCKPTDLTSYWARPDLLVLSDTTVDTCKEMAAFKSTAGAALYAAAVAKSAKVEANRAAAFAASIVIGAKGPFRAPVCIADPAL